MLSFSKSSHKFTKASKLMGYSFIVISSNWNILLFFTLLNMCKILPPVPDKWYIVNWLKMIEFTKVCTKAWYGDTGKSYVICDHSPFPAGYYLAINFLVVLFKVLHKKALHLKRYIWLYSETDFFAVDKMIF